MKYIFKWWIFHCHVSFQGGILYLNGEGHLFSEFFTKPNSPLQARSPEEAMAALMEVRWCHLWLPGLTFLVGLNAVTSATIWATPIETFYWTLNILLVKWLPSTFWWLYFEGAINLSHTHVDGWNHVSAEETLRETSWKMPENEGRDHWWRNFQQVSLWLSGLFFKGIINKHLLSEYYLSTIFGW